MFLLVFGASHEKAGSLCSLADALANATDWPDGSLSGRVLDMICSNALPKAWTVVSEYRNLQHQRRIEIHPTPAVGGRSSLLAPLPFFSTHVISTCNVITKARLAQVHCIVDQHVYAQDAMMANGNWSYKRTRAGDQANCASALDRSQLHQVGKYVQLKRDCMPSVGSSRRG